MTKKSGVSGSASRAAASSAASCCGSPASSNSSTLGGQSRQRARRKVAASCRRRRGSHAAAKQARAAARAPEAPSQARRLLCACSVLHGRCNVYIAHASRTTLTELRDAMRTLVCTCYKTSPAQ